MTFGQKCRVIWRLIRINMANTMAYRFEFLIFMLNTIITPVIGLAIWRASAASGANLPVSTSYLTTYFVISSLFALATSSWHDMFLPSMIREGKLSIWLLRPGSVFYEIFANNLSEKVIKFVFLAPMVTLFGWAFRDDLAIPTDALRWAGALVSVMLGAVFYFALAALTGAIGFWWEETVSVRTGIILAEGVLMGGIIPLALFPDWSQGFMDAQPFRYRFAFALDVLLRDMSTTELVSGFIWQVVWTAAMVAGAVWLWNRGRQSYVAVGG